MIKAKKYQDEKAEKEYSKLLKSLKSRIPQKEYHEVLSQYECEYDMDFLGFLNIYKALSKIIPKHFIVIDFGCYLAPQSYYFINHKQYIGVDVVKLTRFKPLNAVHYITTIQEYICKRMQWIEQNNDHIFAICSYVPDKGACELVRKNFKNVFCFYPS